MQLLKLILTFSVIFLTNSETYSGKLAFKQAPSLTTAIPDIQLMPKLPIVFSTRYDINLFGLEKVYWFDPTKYGKVFNHLVKNVGIPKNRFHMPHEIGNKDLAKVHTQEYLNVLDTDSSRQVARIAEFYPLGWLPNSTTKYRILDPMKLATGGTIKAIELALSSPEKWAINIGGGYHHAKGTGRNSLHDEGHGFCVYGDIQLSIEKAWEKNPNLKVMIVDLDAHQGNGHAAYFKNNPRVAIFDMYCTNNYPNDHQAAQYITYNYPLPEGIQDKQYLGILKDQLPQAIDEFKPDYILYNAGTDPHEHDPIGHMKVTDKGLIERDAFVFQLARTKNVPIAMVLSGGYTKSSAKIISQSIENILKNIVHAIK